METLDKLHLSITVHMYVLVAIEDVLTYVHFNPQCFKLEEKKKRYIKTTTTSVSTVATNTRFTHLFDASIK